MLQERDKAEDEDHPIKLISTPSSSEKQITEMNGDDQSVSRSEEIMLDLGSIDMKKQTAKNQRNDSGMNEATLRLSNPAGIPGGSLDNIGFFDSGGTNESQKLNFFENRYAPDDELEMGSGSKTCRQPQ